MSMFWSMIDNFVFIDFSTKTKQKTKKNWYQSVLCTVDWGWRFVNFGLLEWDKPVIIPLTRIDFLDNKQNYYPVEKCGHPFIKILLRALECDKLINFVKVWKVFVQFEAVIHGTASKEWV